MRGVAAIAAGTYTLPFSVDSTNQSISFPFGVADLAVRDGGHPFDAESFAAVPIWIGVGGADSNPADLPRAWDAYLETTCLERARTFVSVLRQLQAPVSLTVFPSVDHSLTSDMRAIACDQLSADENVIAAAVAQ